MFRPLLAAVLTLPAPVRRPMPPMSTSACPSTSASPASMARINIGNMPPPVLMYPQPVVIQPAPVAVQQPIYLHVPPGHARLAPPLRALRRPQPACVFRAGPVVPAGLRRSTASTTRRRPAAASTDRDDDRRPR